MKTYGSLYEKICDYENLLTAHKEARRGKKNKREIMEYHQTAETRLLALRESLLEGTWSPEPYREFVRIGPTKRRVIHAPAYSDRVVHHAICRIAGPVLERRWIHDSYACRKGKGVHGAVKRVRDFLRKPGSSYVLQIDISKYYPSINHRILAEFLSRCIREERVIDLLGKILIDFAPDGKGLPIGALTSQMLANTYLDELDHFAKECIGARSYVRYMDDIVICGGKEFLRSAWEDIRWFADARLRLQLNPKSSLYPAKQGVNFCGYRIWTNKIRPRKRTIKAAKARFESLSKRYARGEITLKAVRPRVMSFLGYISHCNGYNSGRSVLRRLVLRRPAIKSQ